MIYVFSREYFSHSFITRNITKKKKIKREPSSKRFESEITRNLGDTKGVLSPSGQFEHAIVINIVVEKSRREGRRRHAALFVFEGPSPPFLPSLSHDKIYTQKLHAKSAQPRAGTHTCENENQCEFSRTRFPPFPSALQTFRGFSSNFRQYVLFNSRYDLAASEWNFELLKISNVKSII